MDREQGNETKGLLLVLAFGAGVGCLIGAYWGAHYGDTAPAPCLDAQLNTAFTGAACEHERHRLRYAEHIGAVCLCAPAEQDRAASVGGQAVEAPGEAASRSAANDHLSNKGRP